MNYLEFAIALRRELHKIPELGWGEFCTTARIIEEIAPLGFHLHTGLAQVGLEAVMGRSPTFVRDNLKRAHASGVKDGILAMMQGYTGCIAEFDSGRPGPVTALRFDIDCVGIQETINPNHLPNARGFSSIYEGKAHACGHDGHVAVGVTLAKWISDHRDRFKGRIKLIFQPAEEGVCGAAAQAASGLLDDVDYILGAHLAMMSPTGEVTVQPTGVLCTTKLDVRLTGVPAHPTLNPQKGRNALQCACACVMGLTGISRHGAGQSYVNVGVLTAGEGRNYVASRAQFQMEVSGQSDDVNGFMLQEAQRIIEGNAIAYGVEYEIEKAGESCELNNDPELVDLVRECAKEVSSVKNIAECKNMGCPEDYTMLAARVQAHGGKSEFFVVGADRTANHHSSGFDFDEQGIATAFEIFQNILERLNGV